VNLHSEKQPPKKQIISGLFSSISDAELFNHMLSYNGEEDISTSESSGVQDADSDTLQPDKTN
jgi:hypothetical protein